MTANPDGLAEFDLPLEELERYRPPLELPDDFDEFWRATLAEAASHPLDLELDPASEPLTSLEAFEVGFRGYGGERIHGWLIRDPDLPGPRPCIVEYLGYGSGRGTVLDHLGWASCGYVHLVVETRGQVLPWRAGRTVDEHHPGPHVPGWATRGIGSPDTYYYRRVFTDAVRGLEAARAIEGVDPGRVVAAGGSQGGLIALAAAGLGEVAAALVNVPYGCNYPRAIRLTDLEPFSEIASYLRVYRDQVDQVMGTLRYFDGVHLATRATAPALFSAGLMDRLCPPSTVYAAFNHYGGPCEIRPWPFNGHEGGETDQVLESLRWLSLTLG